MCRILIVFGTRPEAIKLAPLIKRLKHQAEFELKVVITGQHRQMVDQVLTQFDIQPDVDLQIMSAEQDLTDIHIRLLPALREVLTQLKPDLVVVHGDTSSAFVAALAAYYQQIPIAHIEAGLRTGNLRSPYPEEANRRLMRVLADYHFAPTEQARQNLLNEGVSEHQIWVTGNTVIDALMETLQKIAQTRPLAHQLENTFAFLDRRKTCILVTGHRRENWGAGLAQLCQALAQLAYAHPDVQIVYPVHLNPKVQKTVNEKLAGIENVFLLEPQAYLPFVYLMSQADLILTDSGGIQEEACALGKPVLLLRETTERQEAVATGLMTLVGTDCENIIKAVRCYLVSSHKMSRVKHLYGDGQASQRIVERLLTIWKQNGAF